MPLTRHHASRPARDDATTRLSVPRLLAGAFAGLVGGLLFGALMVAPAVAGAPAFNGMGLMTMLSELLGTGHLGLLWGVHAVASALFGALFAAFVRPSGLRHVLPMAFAWSALLWLANVIVLLPLLAGRGLGFEGGALWNLLGHLAYGAGLGVTYVAFFREEVSLLRDHGRMGAPRA